MALANLIQDELKVDNNFTEAQVIALQKLFNAVAQELSPGDIDSEDVNFDPAGAPGVSATNVQGAIEELAVLVDGAQ